MPNHILTIVATVLAFGGTRVGTALDLDQEDVTRTARSVQSWQSGQDPYHGPYTETGYGEYSWDYLTPDYAKYWWPDRKPPQTPPSKNPPPTQGRSSFFDEDDFEDFEDSFDSEDVSDAPKKIRRKPSRAGTTGGQEVWNCGLISDRSYHDPFSGLERREVRCFRKRSEKPSKGCPPRHNAHAFLFCKAPDDTRGVCCEKIRAQGSRK